MPSPYGLLDATHGAWLGRLCSLGAIGASLHKPLFVFALMSAARRAPRPRRTLTHLSAAHMLQTVALRVPALFRTRSHSSSAARAATSAFLCCCANKGGRSRRRSRRRSRYLEVCWCSWSHRSRHRQRCSWSRSWRCSRSRNLESSPRRSHHCSRNRTRRTQSCSSRCSQRRSWRCSHTSYRNPTISTRRRRSCTSRRRICHSPRCTSPSSAAADRVRRRLRP